MVEMKTIFYIYNNSNWSQCIAIEANLIYM